MKKAIRLLKLIDLLQHPGKTKSYLSKVLGHDIRTIERDLIELKQIGFDNDKDEAGRYFIFPNSLSDKKVYLSTNEADFISELMAQFRPMHPLTQSVQTKLYFHSGMGKWLSNNLRKNVPQVIADLTDAMKMNCQIEILDYYSAYQGKLITRKVEPLSYTINYRYLIAYEASDDLFVNIKIDRIKKINILDEKCTKSPDDAEIDIFQMAFNQKKHPVCLLLTPLAYRILVEERPGADDLIKPYEDETFKFKFSTMVATYLPISRFCMGLPGHIQVVDAPDLVTLLKKCKKEFLW